MSISRSGRWQALGRSSTARWPLAASTCAWSNIQPWILACMTMVGEQQHSREAALLWGKLRPGVARIGR